MNILLLDDHTMTLEGYASILKHQDTEFHKLLNCEQFYQWLEQGHRADVAVIDHDLPAFPEQGLYNGADCALLLRKNSPSTRIVLVTAHTEVLLLYTIHKKVKPDVMLSKEDVAPEEFRALLYSEMHTAYQSSRIRQAVKEANLRISLLDDTNREILMYLSKGFKVKDLEDVVFLTKSAIQKRLSKIQNEFNVKDVNDLIKVLINADFL